VIFGGTHTIPRNASRQGLPNTLPLRAVPKIGPNPGPEATYTEHDSDTSEKPENKSKSGARNHLDLQLRTLTSVALASDS